jgi:hypothetical protein
MDQAREQDAEILQQQGPSGDQQQPAPDVVDSDATAGEGYWKCDWCSAIKHESEEVFHGYTDEECTEELDAAFCSMKCALDGANSGQFHYTEAGASANRAATIGGIILTVLIIAGIILWNVFCGE